MTTAIVHHPVFEKHDTGAGHPERPERYRLVMDTLRGDGELWPQLLEIEADEAARGVVQACQLWLKLWLKSIFSDVRHKQYETIR